MLAVRKMNISKPPGAQTRNCIEPPRNPRRLHANIGAAKGPAGVEDLLRLGFGVRAEVKPPPVACGHGDAEGLLNGGAQVGGLGEGLLKMGLGGLGRWLGLVWMWPLAETIPHPNQKPWED